MFKSGDICITLRKSSLRLCQAILGLIELRAEVCDGAGFCSVLLDQVRVFRLNTGKLICGINRRLLGA